MTPDRLDELLERALETGDVPADATPEERGELDAMLASAGALRLNASQVAAEASDAMPVARARFQRHLAEARQPAALPPAATRQAKPRAFARMFAGRGWAVGSSIAAIGVLAVLALLIIQPFSNVETASALTIDDYVQVQGVVAAVDGSTVTVQSSELGDLAVGLSDLTSVTDESGARDAASIQAGQPVVVGGVVTAKRAIAASAVAVARAQAAPGQAETASIPVLKRFREGLDGTIRLVSLSPDGKRARVLVVLPNESLFVDVDRASVDALLASNPTALGSRVRVLAAVDLPAGVFRLQRLSEPSDTTVSGPQFQNVRGVVIERNLLMLRVRTDRGDIPVLIRPRTAFRFGDSGLTLDDIREGEALVGHEVVIAGNPDAKAPRGIVAEIIVVLAKPAPTR